MEVSFEEKKAKLLIEKGKFDEAAVKAALKAADPNYGYGGRTS